MKNIAIVGCGNMGGGHALAIGDGTGYTDWQIPQVIDPEIEAVTTDISKKLRLAGICDIDPVRQDWAKNEGYHVYPSFEDVLADPQVDIVLVATPNDLHKELSIKAMRAGKHVLCEKPATPTSAELEEILAVSRETGKVFYPRQNRRWDPDYLAIKAVYDDHRLGKPLNVWSCMGGGKDSGTFGWRREKRYGGGMMLDWGVHLIDRILQMNPSKITSIFCQAFGSEDTDVDQGFNLNLYFEDGFVAYIEAGTGHTAAPVMGWRLNCEDGVVVSPAMVGDKAVAIKSPPRNNDFMTRHNTLPTRKEPVPLGTPFMFPPRPGNVEEPVGKIVYDRNSLYRNLVNCIEGTEEQLVTGEQALRVLKVMETALRSSELHRALDFE